MSKQKKEDCVYLEYATADANIASKTFCTLQHANEVVKKKNPLAWRQKIPFKWLEENAL